MDVRKRGAKKGECMLPLHPLPCVPPCHFQEKGKYSCQNYVNQPLLICWSWRILPHTAPPTPCRHRRSEGGAAVPRPPPLFAKSGLKMHPRGSIFQNFLEHNIWNLAPPPFEILWPRLLVNILQYHIKPESIPIDFCTITNNIQSGYT